jgi:hypothetical protein
MFVLCPHCQFLVAIDAASGQPPSRCPRCRKLLQQPAATAEPEADIAGEPDAATLVAPDAVEAHAVEPQPVNDATDAVATGGIASPDEASPPPGPDAAATIEAEAVDVTPATVAPPAAAPKPSRKRTRTATANNKPRAKARASRSKTAPVAATPAAAEMPPASSSTPGFVQRQRVRIARSSHTQRWMIAAIALLSLLLLLQLLLADRANLARDARWRPAMTALCGAVHCTLPAWHEPAAFTLLDRDVRPRPGMPGVLRVTATFRNDARWPQPWPALLLTLSDVDGRATGARVFTPREYLGAVPTQSTLASGQSAMLSMDVLEPGPRIVAFTFDFR